VAGVIADKWGRRRLLLVSLAAFSGLGLMPLFFSTLPAILASRVVVGLAEACILTCCNALWGDYFGDDDRRRWLGIQQMTGPVFNALLALAGGALAATHWAGPFWLYAIGLLVLVLVSIFIWEPSREAAEGGASPAAIGHFPWRTAGMISAATLGVSVVFFILAIQQGRVFSALGVSSPADNGVLIMAVSGGAIVGAIAFSLLRRHSIGRLLALGLAAYGSGFIGISQSPTLAIGAVFSTVAQFGSSIVLPALIAWTLASFSFEHRGRGIGIWGAVFFAGQFLSAPVLTLFEHWRGGLLAALGTIGAITLLAAVAGWWASGRSTITQTEVAS
jgi:MFS family permease